ncbi:MAG: extracellular solute-binding protein [Elusimicrobiota bacterium]|jgi:spermidine/putrescine-binding protein|nr:extracellular solute-binding protein [Elusimicrobiota bacterium]
MLKKFAYRYLIFLAAAAVIVLNACSTKESAKKEAGEVNLFIWSEYMPESVIKAFEKETGIKVNMTVYSSNEEMLAKVKSANKGLYDIVVPSDYMVEMMIREKALAKIDKSKVANFKNINSFYLKHPFDPDNSYSVPFMAGLAAIIVNTKTVKEKITTFSQLNNPKYKKSIVVLNDARAVIGAISMSLGFSINAVKDEELKKVNEKLQQLKPNIKLRDSDSPKTAMLNGETSIGYMWTAEIAICMLEKPGEFEVVFPTEGSYIFIDSLAITDGAKNLDNALKFIDFILRPEISAMISAEYPYTNPNKAAEAFLTDSYKNNPASNLPAEIIKKAQYPKDIGSKIEKYDEMWTRFVK